MEFGCFLGDHSKKAAFGVVGIGRASSAAESAVEAFESTGGAQVAAFPGRELLFQKVVGDSGAEVTAQGGDSLRLGVTIGAGDFQVAAQNGIMAVSLPDGVEVFEDSFAMSTALLSGKVIGQADGVVEVAELVEEAALILSAEVDGAQSGAQAAAPVMDDQLQAVLMSDSLLFQDTEKIDPFVIVLTLAQLPEQDFAAVGVRPNPHGDENRAFEAPFYGPPTPFAVATDLTVGSQECDPDSINLQDGRDIGRVIVRHEVS
mgnify:CR=1 FL=1